MAANVILGIGSNLGTVFDNLRRTYKQLCQTPQLNVLQVSPLYRSEALLPQDAPPSWNQPFINLAIKCQTSLTPRELLAVVKKIETTLGRQADKRWAPRIVDIDILAWDYLIYNDEHLQIPHPELMNRPFALWPLLDLLPHWQHPNKPRTFDDDSFGTHRIAQRIDTPALIGILNVTPDSFSDGGHYPSVADAFSHAKKLAAEGAEIIDIGAESTRPGAIPLSPETEWQRISPILQQWDACWKKTELKPQISIDSYHASTIEKALDYKIDWINDVSGQEAAAIATLLQGTDKKYVIMHHLGIPADSRHVFTNDTNYIEEIYRYGAEKIESLVQRGLHPKQLVFDVGIGFGKTAAQSLDVLKKIEHFKKLNVPLLVGHSRKSFLTLMTRGKPKERDVETVVVSLFLAQHQVDYLRVHNIAIHEQAFRTSSFLQDATVWNDPKITTLSS